MSAASHLHLPITGTAVPDEMSYHVPAPASRVLQRHKSRRRAKPALALNPIFSIGLCAGLCLAVGLGLVGQKAQLMTLNYELAGLQAQLSELEKEHGQLQVALVAAQSPGRVEQVARNQMGMTEPEHVEYLVLAGADIGQDELPLAAQASTEDHGLIAKLGLWLNGNWPRLGTAEASPRP